MYLVYCNLTWVGLFAGREVIGSPVAARKVSDAFIIQYEALKPLATTSYGPAEKM